MILEMSKLKKNHSSFNFLYNQDFIEARLKKNHFFIPNQNLKLFGWKKVVECLNFNFINNEEIQVSENFGLVLRNTNNIKIIQDNLKKYSELDSSLECSAHLYVSLTEESKTFGWHCDDSDVLFWQVIGYTDFKIEQNGVHNYKLVPNDLLYIPKKIYHNTNPLTPRVGVSFGLKCNK